MTVLSHLKINVDGVGEREVENDALAFRYHGRMLAILLLCSVPLF